MAIVIGTGTPEDRRVCGPVEVNDLGAVFQGRAEVRLLVVGEICHGIGAECCLIRVSDAARGSQYGSLTSSIPRPPRSPASPMAARRSPATCGRWHASSYVDISTNMFTSASGASSIG